MSFLVPPQRGLADQPLPSPPLHNIPPRSHLPLSSLPAFPHHDMPPPAQPISTPFAPDPSPHSPPRSAETRCYWSLLSSDLRFIYLGPVLASHLEDQAELLVGKSLLSYVHPEEQASARADLSDALEQRTMHGTVTRVRYCRLSRVRRFLGYTGPLPQWSDGDKIALDNHYMAVDIVISWAAEGLVLCFIHAVTDLVPADNDEQRKTPWTNWCGTPPMNPEQLTLLDQRLRSCCPQPGVLTRVFQILSNSTVQDYKVLFSWPPDASHEYSNKPSAREFAKRVSAVQTSAHDSSAKTSCTRRWRIVGTMPAVVGEVESVFIPHGTIMFACHTIQSSSRNSPGTSAQPSYASRAQDTYPSHHTPPAYDVPPSSYTLPPVNTSSPSYGHFVTPLPPYSSPSWPSHSESSSLLNYNRWPQNNSPTTHALSSLPPPCSLRETPYGAPPSGRPSESPSYGDTRGPQHGYQPTPSPELDYADRHRPDNIGLPISASADIVPPPRHRVSPSSAREPVTHGGRNGNRPVGILQCSSCKATSSPEWRKGPSGKKELCNACGLRYARSRAKKDGHVAGGQRRKKERTNTIVAKEEVSPSQSSPIAIAGSGTRGSTFESTSFASTSSVGSASGSEVYSQHSPIPPEPSPSPPSTGLNFVHYSRPPPPPPPPQGLVRNEGRTQFHLSNGPFHPTPSPLSNQPPQRAFRGSDESIMSSSRLAPYGYVTTPAMASGGNAIAPLSSFEREKADERHVAATSSADRKYERYAMQR